MSSKQRCPLCNSYSKHIKSIPNAGKGYTHCCKKCERVAALIVENYPYNRSWFKSDISIEALLHYKHWQMPIPLDNCKINDQETARDFVQATYQTLVDKLITEIKLFSTLDLLTYLGRFYDHISNLMRIPEKTKNLLEVSQFTSEGMLVQRLYQLRDLVLLLQKFVIYAGVRTNKQEPNLDSILDLIAITDNVHYIASIDDGLYYLEDWMGIFVVDRMVYPINEEMGIPQSVDTDDLETLMTSMNNERIEGYKKLPAYYEEFYKQIFKLDKVLESFVGFTATEIFTALLFLSDFANKYNGTFIATLDEYYSLLVKALGSVKSRNLQSLGHYLLLETMNTVPKPYEISQSFYSPIYHIPIGNYSVVILNKNIIDNSRTAFFHNLTYGSHPFLTKDKNCRRTYDKLKQKYITTPFEEDVGKCFEDFGWKVFLNIDGGIRINNKVVAIVPKTVGEIDFIATDPLKKILFIGDCKYLYDYGSVAKELRTLQQKFFDPKKGYFAQVTRKYEWVLTELDAFKNMLGIKQNEDDLLIAPLIITRNKISALRNDRVILFSFHDLNNLLNSNNYYALTIELTKKFDAGSYTT